MIKRVLVVGGAGYIGGAVTDLLLKIGHPVLVYDALLYEAEYRKPVDFVRGDIRDRELLKKHLAWADTVIWLAALVADGSCALYPDLAMEFNQESVKWLAGHFDGRIIFPSTCLVYAIQEGVLNEESRTDPSTEYTKTKLAAEAYLKDKNAIIFRLSTVFGAGDAFSRPRLDLVVNLLTARAFIEKKMTVFGGEQFRPFIHVRDVARAMVENVETAHRGVYNIHTENMSILALAERIRRQIPHAAIDVKEMPVSVTGDYRVSSEHARDAWGFQPRLSIEEGVSEVKDLIVSGRLKDIRNPRYSNEAFLKAHPIT